MHIASTRSDFLYKFNNVDPEKGKELDSKLRQIQCDLIINVATHGIADEQTLKIYDKINKARSYANLRKIHPLETALTESDAASGSATSGSVGATGMSSSSSQSSKSSALSSSSSISKSDI